MKRAAVRAGRASPIGLALKLGRNGEEGVMGGWAGRLHEIRMGPPQGVGRVTALPLLGRDNGRRERRLVPVGLALRGGQVSVEECPSAAVARLVVTNRDSHSFVFGIGGEMLCGGRQDRVVNGSFIIGPREAVQVPVSCVEQHRWSGGARFHSAEALATSQVRSQLHDSVHSHVTRVGTARRSAQGRVWDTVDLTCETAQTVTSTGSLRHVYEVDQDRIREQCARFPLLPDQAGLALFVGDKLQSVDLFGGPDLLAHYQPRLLAAVLADPRAGQEASAGDPEQKVSDLLGQIAGTHAWAALPVAGECEEIRPSVSGLAVSALLWQGALEHLQAHPSQDPPAVSVAPTAGGSVLELSVQIEQGALFRVCLGQGELLVGRSSRCDLRIDEPTVSRRHAALLLRSGGLQIRDLESSNGIEVNGKDTRESGICVGDRVGLGGHVQLEVLRVGEVVG